MKNKFLADIENANRIIVTTENSHFYMDDLNMCDVYEDGTCTISDQAGQIHTLNLNDKIKYSQVDSIYEIESANENIQYIEIIK